MLRFIYYILPLLLWAVGIWILGGRSFNEFIYIGVFAVFPLVVVYVVWAVLGIWLFRKPTD